MHVCVYAYVCMYACMVITTVTYIFIMMHCFVYVYRLAAPSIIEESDSESYEAVVDTGRWKPVEEYFQLRMQMISPGKAVYSPAEVAMKGLQMLCRIAAVHRSANSRGVPFFPIRK
jgi:hypothetical protein